MICNKSKLEANKCGVSDVTKYNKKNSFTSEMKNTLKMIGISCVLHPLLQMLKLYQNQCQNNKVKNKENNKILLIKCASLISTCLLQVHFGTNHTNFKIIHHPSKHLFLEVYVL